MDVPTRRQPSPTRNSYVGLTGYRKRQWEPWGKEIRGPVLSEGQQCPLSGCTAPLRSPVKPPPDWECASALTPLATLSFALCLGLYRRDSGERRPAEWPGFGLGLPWPSPTEGEGFACLAPLRVPPCHPPSAPIPACSSVHLCAFAHAFPLSPASPVFQLLPVSLDVREKRQTAKYNLDFLLRCQCCRVIEPDIRQSVHPSSSQPASHPSSIHL